MANGKFESPRRVAPAEPVVIVLVGVVGQNAEDPHANHLQERVILEWLMPRVVECPRKRLGQTDLFVELANRQQTGVTGQLSRRRFDHNRLGAQKIE